MEKAARQNQNSSKLKCPHCPKKLSSGQRLRGHIDTDHKCKRFLCDACFKVFPSWSECLRHSRLPHTNQHCRQGSYTAFYDCDGDKRQIFTGPFKKECPCCEITFDDVVSKSHHYNEVHRKRRFKCDSCDETFASYRQLGPHNGDYHHGSATFSTSYLVKEPRGIKCEICKKSL